MFISLPPAICLFCLTHTDPQAVYVLLWSQWGELEPQFRFIQPFPDTPGHSRFQIWEFYFAAIMLNFNSKDYEEIPGLLVIGAFNCIRSDRGKELHRMGASCYGKHHLPAQLGFPYPPFLEGLHNQDHLPTQCFILITQANIYICQYLYTQIHTKTHLHKNTLLIPAAAHTVSNSAISG